MNKMEKFKTIDLKDKKQANLCILHPEQNDVDYMLLAVSKNRQVGYCYFSIKDSDCKMYRIAVTDKNFLHAGLGSAMFDAMEQFAGHNGAKCISGFFVERGYPNANEMTSNFYKNHGFMPENGDDFLEREYLVKNICPQTQFEVPVVANKELYKQLSHYNFAVNDIFSSDRSKQTKEEQFEL